MNREDKNQVIADLKGKLEESSRLKSNQPDGPLKDMWTSHKFSMNLVNPANKRKYKVPVSL